MSESNTEKPGVLYYAGIALLVVMVASFLRAYFKEDTGEPSASVARVQVEVTRQDVVKIREEIHKIQLNLVKLNVQCAGTDERTKLLRQDVDILMD